MEHSPKPVQDFYVRSKLSWYRVVLWALLAAVILFVPEDRNECGFFSLRGDGVRTFRLCLCLDGDFFRGADEVAVAAFGCDRPCRSVLFWLARNS